MRLILALALSITPIAPALASGSTMSMPMPEEMLGSYAVCLANLKTVHSLDVRRIDTTAETRDDGSVLQRSLTTDGVIETGAETALYKAEYGTTVTARDGASGQLKHQYSWERVEMNCTGEKLTGITSQGYASPSFEPIPKAAP